MNSSWDPDIVENIYETNELVDQYLLFHYGVPSEVLPWDDGPHAALDFAVRLVTDTFDFERIPKGARALDLGCAVGRSSFELSKSCEEVVGIDYSQAFIDAAKSLPRDYERIDQGEISTRLTARIPEGTYPDRITFEQGDAMHLREDLGSFDCVLLANLICRLSEPKLCMDRLADLVKPGGQLVITSPYTWLDDYTPRSHWLGAREREGDSPWISSQALEDTLFESFKLKKKKNLPFLIRETERKYQWTVSEATIWDRV